MCILKAAAQQAPYEEPRYEAIAEAISAALRRADEIFKPLRESWQTAASYAAEAVQAAESAIQESMAAFFRAFLGGEQSRAGFVRWGEQPSVLQEAVALAAAVGKARGAALVDIDPEPLADADLEMLLGRAWDALCGEDGRLRCVRRLEELGGLLIAGILAGATAELLVEQTRNSLNGYQRGRLDTIVQTEMAAAAEAGIQKVLLENGVVYVTVEGNPNTDENCTEHFGVKYLSTEDHMFPPYHPNCQCTVIPWPGDEEAATLVVRRGGQS